MNLSYTFGNNNLYGRFHGAKVTFVTTRPLSDTREKLTLEINDMKCLE